MSKANQFNFSLHGFRGLAALMVFVAHMIDGFTEHIYGSSTWLTKGLINLGTFGVEIFFFLSGYVIYIATTKSNIKDFFFHRFWRIYPFLFTVLFFILNMVVGKEPDKNDPFFLIMNLFFLNLFASTPPLSPNAWSITYEAWYYLLTYALIRPIVIQKNYIVSYLALIGWVLFTYYYPITVFYLLGILVSFLSQKYNFKRFVNNLFMNTVQVVSLISVLFLAFSYDYKYDINNIFNNYNLLMLYLSFSIFMFLFIQNEKLLSKYFNSKLWLTLGTVSYTFYLAHPYSYLVSRILTQKVQSCCDNILFLSILFILLTVTFTSVLVYIVHKYIEVFVYNTMTGKKIYVPKIG